MSLSKAARLATLASGQAATAASIVQKRVATTYQSMEQKKEDENMALAIANLAHAVSEMAEELQRRG